MDNQRLEIITEGGVDKIRAALSLIWHGAAPGGVATHWKIMRLKEKVSYFCNEPGKSLQPDDTGRSHSHYSRLVEDPEGHATLIILWHEEQGSQLLPYPLTLDQTAIFIEGWLKNVDYGKEPDHDGDNGKGWRLFTEDWGHVAGHHYAIVGVNPAWAMYGK